MQIDGHKILHIPHTRVIDFDVDAFKKLKPPDTNDINFRYSGGGKCLSVVISLPYKTIDNTFNLKKRITLHPEEYLQYFEIGVKNVPPLHIGSITLFDDTPFGKDLKSAIGFFAWEHEKGIGYTVYIEYKNSILCTIAKFTKVD